MSVKIEFYLSDNDADRLFALKEDSGKQNLTGNEYARELLESSLHNKHPAKVEFNEETGDRVNKRKQMHR